MRLERTCDCSLKLRDKIIITSNKLGVSTACHMHDDVAEVDSFLPRMLPGSLLQFFRGESLGPKLANNGHPRGLVREGQAVDGKQESYLEWPNSCTSEGFANDG